MLPAQPTLTGLPTEVLLKVLSEEDELSTRRCLRQLRLVCRKMDDTAKHLALDTITIPRNPSYVDAMASKPNAFDICARTLKLDGHRYTTDRVVWQSLAILIKKMKAVCTILWVDRRALNREVRLAIGKLPLLKRISFVLLNGNPGNSLTLPQPALNRIKSMSIQLVHYTRSKPIPSQLDADTMSTVLRMVVQSPALEDLAIGPTAIPNQFQLAAIIEERENQHRPPLSLVTMEAEAVVLPTSPNSMQCLAQLTSLRMPNHREFEEAAWPALRTAGIELKVIKVEISSQSMADYIRSYQGLEVFHIGGLASDTHSLGRQYNRSDFRQHIMSALPSHRRTLREIQFLTGLTPDQRHIDAYPNHHLWCIDYPLMACLHRFHKLEILGMILAVYPMSNVSLVNDLNNLASLPATLRMVTVIPIGVLCTRNSRIYSWATPQPLSGLKNVLDRFRFRLTPKNWKTLRVAVNAIVPRTARIPGSGVYVDSIVYDIFLDSTNGKCGFKLNPGATELLSDKRSPHWEFREH